MEELQTPEQSQDQATEKTYEWSGRSLTADELASEAKQMASEFTRKSQRVAELEQKYEALVSAQENAKQADLSEDEQTLKEAANKLLPYLAPHIEARAKELTDRSRQEEQALVTMREQFKEAKDLGSKIGVSMNREEEDRVLAFMAKERIHNPLIAFKLMHEDKLIEYHSASKNANKKAIYSEQGGRAPVSSGGIDTKKYKGISDPDFKQALVNKVLSNLN
jgi:hypothetical protein